MPMTIESGPIKCSTRASRNPASFIHAATSTHLPLTKPLPASLVRANHSQFLVLVSGHQQRSAFVLHEEHDEFRRFGLCSSQRRGLCRLEKFLGRAYFFVQSRIFSFLMREKARSLVTRIAPK